MYSLYLAILFMVYAVCDFFNLSPFKHMLRALPPDEKAVRKYRILRGIGLLAEAMVAGYVFTTEIIYRTRFRWPDMLYNLLLPYAVPLLYILVLGMVYKVHRLPWDTKGSDTGEASDNDLSHK